MFHQEFPVCGGGIFCFSMVTHDVIRVIQGYEKSRNTKFPYYVVFDCIIQGYVCFILDSLYVDMKYTPAWYEQIW